MLFIFDIGGVCTNNPPLFPLISKELGLAKEVFLFYCGMQGGKAPDFLQNKDLKFSRNIFLELTKGLITAQQFWKEFSDRSTCDIKEDYWGTFFNPVRNEKVYKIISRLKVKNKVVNGTNTIQTHYDIHMRKKDYDIFQKIYASQRIHEAKPNINFWKYILKNELAVPSETFFIDDIEENINAAESLGIKTHLYKNAENLESAVAEWL